jgi:hypothetical protein
MSTGNAKNFLAGSLADQGYFFDELEGRANFPDMFPCSLVSCALLEKAVHEGHDFIAEPVVYLSHTISVDRRLARSLRSNEALHMLVRGPLLTLAEGERGLIGSGAVKQLYGCVGLVRNQQILYRCEVSLVSLDGIVSARIPKAA